MIAPYQASSNEQLSLERGQLIMIRKKTDSGWWEGELQAKGRKRQVGWFPATYVKVLNSSGRASGRTTPVSTTRMQQEVIIGMRRFISGTIIIVTDSQLMYSYRQSYCTVCVYCRQSRRAKFSQR